jgi:hypothetical protein
MIKKIEMKNIHIMMTMKPKKHFILGNIGQPFDTIAIIVALYCPTRSPYQLKKL